MRLDGICADSVAISKNSLYHMFKESSGALHGEKVAVVRVAVCDNSVTSAEQLQNWIGRYCALYGYPVFFRRFLSPDLFSACRDTFEVVVCGFGGGTGFLTARGLRERDRKCKIILIDDTPEYAIRSVRIHCTDFILRPVEFPKIVHCMHLVTGRRDS
jgi:DNA-binding NarL/FixJ family response regulator